MSITKLFHETFYLSFNDLSLSRSLKPADIIASGQLLIRLGEKKITVHYLTSSDQIIIPGEYINLFLGIDRLIGEQLKDAKTKMEKVLYLGSCFSRMLYGGNKSNISILLSELVKLGSKDLRRYLRTEFDYTLEPWTIRNRHNSIEI